MDFSNVKSITIPEGNVVKITSGGVVLWERPATYTNLLPTATDTDRTTIYNGIGYKTGVRLSSSGSEAVASKMCASGFIPAVEGDILRISGIGYQTSVNHYIIAYDSSNAKTGYLYFHSEDDETFRTGITLDSATFGGGFNAIRFTCGTIDENTIVTINEEIT